VFAELVQALTQDGTPFWVLLLLTPVAIAYTYYLYKSGRAIRVEKRQPEGAMPPPRPQPPPPPPPEPPRFDSQKDGEALPLEVEPWGKFEQRLKRLLNPGDKLDIHRGK
jgi:hypothetical protein